jgi:hypothetical protein
MSCPPNFSQLTSKRRREDRLLILLDEARDMVEVLACAAVFRRQAVDLRDDAALFGAGRQ